MISFLETTAKVIVKFGLLALILVTAISSRPFANERVEAEGGMTTVALHFEPFTAGFTIISSLEFSDSGILYVAMINGRIRTVEPDGTLNPTDFLDIRGQVGSNGKQALSSFVLHPDFETNGTFFVNYTDPFNMTFLSKFQTLPGNPYQADPNSEEVLMSFVQPSEIHNGAGMVFGPDGYLYFGMGDGGYDDDPDNNGQNGLTHLGAIMRIDVDSGSPYAVPVDNPFVGDPNVLDEIWAMGLRNPWGFDFDSLTGDLFIADVGETLWEEINFEPGGSGGGFNYGWRCYQGFALYIPDGCGPPEDYTFPIYAQSHMVLCAIMGGHVYRGSQYPMLAGQFLFADYCSGRTYGIQRQLDGTFTFESSGKLTGGFLTTFGEDANGELYAAARSQVFKITAETVTLTPQSYLPSVHFD